MILLITLKKERRTLIGDEWGGAVAASTFSFFSSFCHNLMSLKNGCTNYQFVFLFFFSFFIIIIIK